MEDPTTKTIDFLRARLLAERSVSRTARQRATELAKRVADLEKQLKYISLQRKKAEKAMTDVLAILENHGRNDLSEPFDSSSDHEEMSSDFKDGKHLETSERLKTQESDTEGFSGSEAESSSVNGRSLSWKRSKNSSSRFLDKKYMDASRRRRNSFTSTGSSPRRVGKSCRQIRHREHWSVAEDSQNEDATNGPEDVQNSADVATETFIEENIREEKDPMEVPTSCNGHSIQSYGTERDMERALEHQAKFIAQYEAEEKAQREWEDKFRENNRSPPDSCDPGTHSDITEERDEIKAAPPAPPQPQPSPTDKLTSGSQEPDARVTDINFSENPKFNTETLLDRKNVNLKNEPSPSDNQSHPQVLEGTPCNSSPYEPTLANQENPDRLGSVLEALQQAKLSLKQNLDKFPLLENGPSVPTYRTEEQFPVPFSSVGLFRLPTDYEYEGTTTPRANSLTYDSRLSLTDYPVDPPGSRFISSPYRESLSISAVSLDDRFRMVPTFSYQQTTPDNTRLPPSAFNPRLDMHPSALDPRLSMHPSARDPRLDAGMGSSPLDPRLSMFPSARDPRLDAGMGSSPLDPRLSMFPSARDPRLDVGMVSSPLDPRSSMRPSARDPRLDLGMGLSARDPRLNVGTGSSALDPRLGVRPSVFDPRLGMGPFASDPRLQADPPFTGDRYTRSIDQPLSSAGLPPSMRYATLPGGDIPLRTRSLYDNYTRPNTYE